MGQFLSCDWGTSSFRLRLVETDNLHIVAEQQSEQGIAPTFALWQQVKPEEPLSRTAFYLTHVQKAIGDIEKKLSVTLRGIPVILSGMASSSIGLKELSYGELPSRTDGRDIAMIRLETGDHFDNPVFLISGLQSEDDVMRGEETQLIGVMSQLGDKDGKKVFIFPGTHSKHIWVKDQQLVHFKTYMTGEFFDLLSKHSVLSASIEENRAIANWKHFNEGVRAALKGNLLNASFMVRTQALFGKVSKMENHDFLSGLLIGTELKEIHQEGFEKIYLCCSSHLKPRYESVLDTLGVQDVQVFSGEDIDRAVIMGQLQIYEQSQSK